MGDLEKYRERLAEFAGIKVNKSTFEQYQPSEWTDSAGNKHQGFWRPDEDVAQAIGLLEALRLKLDETEMYCTREHWTVVMRPLEGKPIYQVHSSLPVAIITAVVKALGWET